MRKRFRSWYSLRSRAGSSKRWPLYPEYKEPRQPFRAIKEPEYLDLDPTELMSKGQAKDVGCLLGRLRRELARERESRDHDVLNELQKRLGSIAEAVLRRTLSLERYMVVDARRDDGYCTVLQALEFDVYDGPRGWMWHISGRAVRKDGTLGTRHSGIGFRDARLRRRLLSGQWVTLRPVVRTEARFALHTR